MSEHVEEYLEAIYTLSEERSTARTSELSRHLKVAPASVTEMLQKLAKQGLVDYTPYRGAVLTGEGARIARRLKRKHRLLEWFFHDILGIGKEKVHSEACKMEHALSNEVDESLCRFLGNPEKCPHEKAIPACDSDCEVCLKEVKRKTYTNLVPLSELKKKDRGRVALIRADRKVLCRLLDMGLVPNTSVEVVELAPDYGPLELSVRGSMLAISREIASQIFVDLAAEGG